MSLSSMRLAMAEAVAADGDLRSWCVLTYGREHSVYLDVDLRDPPGEDACPYVVISSIGQSAAQDRPFKEYFFGVLCIVHEDSDVISIHDNLYMHAGGENAEVFRKLVETAAAGVLVNETLGVDVDADAVGEFPFIRSEMLLKITSPVLIGEDPLE